MTEVNNGAAEPLSILLRAAETRAGGILWRGPHGEGERLLEIVRNREGANFGADWTSYLPDELSGVWDSLSDEARLVAFILAAEAQGQLP